MGTIIQSLLRQDDQHSFIVQPRDIEYSGNTTPTRPLRVELESFFKLVLCFDEGHRVTRLPASSKELVNG
jgi:hypothetical protein